MEAGRVIYTPGRIPNYRYYSETTVTIARVGLRIVQLILFVAFALFCLPTVLIVLYPDEIYHIVPKLQWQSRTEAAVNVSGHLWLDTNIKSAESAVRLRYFRKDNDFKDSLIIFIGEELLPSKPEYNVQNYDIVHCLPFGLHRNKVIPPMVAIGMAKACLGYIFTMTFEMEVVLHGSEIGAK
ncbi:unnamed protein product [Caenorhabditis bovis]|uniref:Transmembrane protein 231 n=1 Tax=Caenorhabditis bovis TaxID=2654633 RepID=A0A8S1ERH7_9PELO|nr:unnamed protein product [Caenorhabditis bovis]